MALIEPVPSTKERSLVSAKVRYMYIVSLKAVISLYLST